MAEVENTLEPDRLDGAPHPRTTAALYGHGAAEQQFIDSVASGRPAHGWMIAGPRGIGKATLAWRIARFMIAGGRGADLDMVPDDPVFRRVAALSEPNVHLCRRSHDPKTNRLRSVIGVDEVRKINAYFRLSSADAGWRVAIVDAADDMTVAAANALLKILEEPPPRAMLLLVCHQPSRLLPTLRSRCRRLQCRPLGEEDLLRALGDFDGAPTSATDTAALAALAGGSVGEAHQIVSGDGLKTYGDVVELLAQMPGMQRPQAVAKAEAYSDRAGFDAFRRLTILALSRLARAGAGAPMNPVSDAEANAQKNLAHSHRQGQLWANAATEIDRKTGAAQALNLDPALVILDTLLKIDSTAAEASKAAA